MSDEIIFLPKDYLYATFLGDIIINVVKSNLKSGAGNQMFFNTKTSIDVDGGTIETDYPAYYLTSETRQLTAALNNHPIGQNSRKSNGPRRSALAACKIGAGNCGEHASLAYVLCREYFPSEWTVARVSAKRMDHAFVLVWKGDNPQDISYVRRGKGKFKTKGVIAIDPWPIRAQAVIWEDHFAHEKLSFFDTFFNDSSVNFLNKKKCLGKTMLAYDAVLKMGEHFNSLRRGKKYKDMRIVLPSMILQACDKYTSINCDNVLHNIRARTKERIEGITLVDPEGKLIVLDWMAYNMKSLFSPNELQGFKIHSIEDTQYNHLYVTRNKKIFYYDLCSERDG